MLRTNKLLIKEMLFWVSIYLFVFILTFFISRVVFKFYLKTTEQLPFDLLKVEAKNQNELFYWFTVFEILSKELQISAVENSQIYAYIANIYLEISKTSKTQADLAIYRFLYKQYPHSELYLKQKFLESKSVDDTLTKDSLSALNKFSEKFNKDILRVSISDNVFKENGTWKLIGGIGEPRKAEMPGAFNFSRWTLDDKFEYKLRSPEYVKNNESQKIPNYNQDEKVNILFWNAGRGGQSLSYIWQKILIENTQETDKLKILNKQKQLAELIADGYTITFTAKYNFQTLRPDQKDPLLKSVVKTPKSPSFPSEHAVICTLASLYLKDMDVGSGDIYEKQKLSCLQSRENIGVDFKEDLEYGMLLGEQVYNYAHH